MVKRRRNAASCVASTGPAGSASASSVAPTCDAARMWPRSPIRPSEISSAACARPRSASRRPSAMRGVGMCMRGAAAASSAGVSTCSFQYAPSARRASPSVPEIQTSSPTRAAARRSAWPGASSPKIVMQIVSGPLVVSPPISSQSCSSARANRPALNAASQGRSASGSASASVNAVGRAPIAARSDRFTARHLWPSMRASAPAKKWRPSTSMSEETATCLPGVGARSAQSSPMPRTVPARPARARWKYCLMRSNSESIRDFTVRARSCAGGPGGLCHRKKHARSLPRRFASSNRPR